MKCPNCGGGIPTFKNPFPTVDIIIETGTGIVLIERKNPPHGWALPGGFVDYGESFEHAAIREALEETGLKITLLTQFHTYSDPERDSRQHNSSTVFIASASGMPIAADDAVRAEVFPTDDLPPMVFDHARILHDYMIYRQTGQRPVISTT